MRLALLALPVLLHPTEPDPEVSGDRTRVLGTIDIGEGPQIAIASRNGSLSVSITTRRSCRRTTPHRFRDLPALGTCAHSCVPRRSISMATGRSTSAMRREQQLRRTWQYARLFLGVQQRVRPAWRPARHVQSKVNRPTLTCTASSGTPWRFSSRSSIGRIDSASIPISIHGRA